MTRSSAPVLDEQACWNTVLTKNRAQDGAFFFGVLSTGVYCRPSCPARRPRRENVRFYQTPAQAEADGLRPCLRCRPLSASADPNSERMQQLCDYIRAQCVAGEPLTLARLSQHAGLSPFHLQRSFKATVGITPKQFMDRCRMDALKRNLREKDSVTAAVYETGFGSSSRLYERSNANLGMTPGKYRAGGKDIVISHVAIETSLGPVLLAATDRGLCFLQFGESPDQLLARLRGEFPAGRLQPMELPYPAQFQLWIDAVKRYLEGATSGLDLPLAIRATSFQSKIWKYLQSIPAGSTQSYSQIAAATGNPRGARAVARACATNPVAIVIPCHRVIRGDGGLGGYRGGLNVKRALLERESRP